MAKKVTRTIISTKVTALCINLETVEPYNDTFSISGSFKVTDKRLKSKAEEFYNDSTKQLVQIQSVEPQEKIYGMTEETFMKYAVELDEKRHFIDFAEADEEVETV